MVYLAVNPSIGVKIGTSKDPEKRVKQLGYGWSVVFTVQGGYYEESLLHKFFRRYRLPGSSKEYFDIKVLELSSPYVFEAISNQL